MEAVPASWYAASAGLPEPKEASNKKHEWLVKDDIIVQQHIGETFSQKEELPIKIVMGSTAQSGQLPATLNYNSSVDAGKITKIVSESLLGTMGHAEQALE